MARTTLIIDDGCMKKLKRLAQRENRTLSDLVGELLAEGLQRRERRRKGEPLDLPAFAMGVPRVDVANRHALEEAMKD